MRSYLFTLLLMFNGAVLGQPDSTKLAIIPLTDDTYVYITYGDAGNGHRYPANGMYTVTDSGVVLIDTPWDSTQFQPLLDSIWARHGQPVVLCIATHFHSDRTAGLAYYRQKGIATYTTEMTDSLSRISGKPRAEHLIASDATFTVGEHRFETFYPGPGHSPDNIVVWYSEERVLYGGCFVKSTETKSIGNLSDANVGEWANSIRNVQERFRDPEYIIPGHLGWAENAALDHTLQIVKAYQVSRGRSIR